jgi:hypothetical protein
MAAARRIERRRSARAPGIVTRSEATTIPQQRDGGSVTGKPYPLSEAR